MIKRTLGLCLLQLDFITMCIGSGELISLIWLLLLLDFGMSMMVLSSDSIILIIDSYSRSVNGINNNFNYHLFKLLILWLIPLLVRMLITIMIVITSTCMSVSVEEIKQSESGLTLTELDVLISVLRPTQMDKGNHLKDFGLM